MFCGKVAGQANGSVRAFAGIGVENVCAVGCKNLLALDRNVGGHAESDGKAFGGAQHGVGDAGVSAGGIEQDFSCSKLTAAAALGDDVGGGAIFDGATGIVPFGLTQKCDSRQMIGELIETQQGRVANAIVQ